MFSVLDNALKDGRRAINGILDFRFWILDWGILVQALSFKDGTIVNSKSKISKLHTERVE
ncbi:MAG: hypothetical protein EAZ39_25015 [Oscillatoriales cyanobacterium]|nr:MAG: hypothetical protein EAZ39_25015 [Oscillatoriales cyanobacterium]TAG47232.1 MAG: hypothetical protein EAZ33_05090 [Oscillatoriales cyanobacterium]